MMKALHDCPLCRESEPCLLDCRYAQKRTWKECLEECLKTNPLVRDMMIMQLAPGDELKKEKDAGASEKQKAAIRGSEAAKNGETAAREGAASGRDGTRPGSDGEAAPEVAAVDAARVGGILVGQPEPLNRYHHVEHSLEI